MKDYTKFMKFAVVTFIDRKTQDDRKDKLQVEALFRYPSQAEDTYIPNMSNNEHKRYIAHVDDLEELENYYNFIGDLKEQYGDYWIYHLSEGQYTVDQENTYRTMLDLWTN